MAETVVLKAEIRKQLGKKRTAALREEGKMPVAIYGHKQDPVSIVIDSHKFIEALRHGQRVFDIDIEGKSEKLLIKSLQYDHFGTNVIHADLMRVNLKEKVTVEVSLELKGIAAGATHGGIVDELLTSIQVECTITNIPESIPVLIKDLEIGDSLHVRDIKLPEGVKLITDPEAVVLNCHLVAAAKSTEDAEEEVSSTPEVITEKKEAAEG